LTRRRVFAGAAAIAAIAWGVIAAAQNAPTFRGGVNIVAVGVSVRQAGLPVVDLQAADFQLRDNGVEQQIIDVSYEKLPADVTVALDVSQSVTGELLDSMRRAVAQLSDDLVGADRLKIFTFNMRIQRVLNFDDDRTATDAALARVSAAGTTSLLDTLSVALMAPQPTDRRHLILMFSDGMDTGSVTDRDTVLALARLRSAVVTFVLPPSGAMGEDAPVRKFYEQIAQETGGMVVFMRTGDDLGPTFQRVLSDFRASYVLHFQPSGVPVGGNHRLDVRVRRGGVDVRARRSYGWQ
jgi:VWFA-related protein